MAGSSEEEILQKTQTYAHGGVFEIVGVCSMMFRARISVIYVSRCSLDLARKGFTQADLEESLIRKGSGATLMASIKFQSIARCSMRNEECNLFE